MAGVFIPVNLNLGVGGVDLLDLLGGNVRVELAEVKLNRGGGILTSEAADAAGVVANRRVGMKP